MIRPLCFFAIVCAYAASAEGVTAAAGSLIMESSRGQTRLWIFYDTFTIDEEARGCYRFHSRRLLRLVRTCVEEDKQKRGDGD